MKACFDQGSNIYNIYLQVSGDDGSLAFDVSMFRIANVIVW